MTDSNDANISQSERTGPRAGSDGKGGHVAAISPGTVGLINGQPARPAADYEHRFRPLAQAATDAIVATDGQGKVIFWNRGAELLCGYSAEEMVGRALDAVIPDRNHPAYCTMLREAVREHESQWLGRPFLCAGLHKSGREVSLEVSVTVWREGGRVVLAGIAQDATERQRAERKLASDRGRWHRF